MPIGNYRFKIEIDGIQVGGFSEIKGFSTSMNTFEYQEGGINAYAHTFAAGYKHENLTLIRGFLDKSLLDWYKKIKQGQIELKSGSVVLLDSKNKELVRWNFNDAYPVKFQSDPLSALGSEIVMESLELVHSGLNIPMDAPPTPPASPEDARPVAPPPKKNEKDKDEDDDKKSSMFGLLDALEDVVDTVAEPFFDLAGLDYDMTKDKLINQTFANVDTSKLTDNFAAVAIKGVVNGDSPGDILKDSTNALVDDIEEMAQNKINEVTKSIDAGVKAYKEGKSFDQVAGDMAGAYTKENMKNMGYPDYACNIGAAGASAGVASLARGDSLAGAKANAYGAMAEQSAIEMGMDEDKAALIGKGTKMAVDAKNKKKAKKKGNKSNKKEKDRPDLSKYNKDDVDKAVNEVKDKYNTMKDAFGL